MENNLSYKNRIVWVNDNGYFCALGGLMADTVEGIMKLIDQKIKKEERINGMILCEWEN